MGRRFLSEEQKIKFREKRNKTMMEKYGCLSFTNIDKVKKTKLKKYGDENYNNQTKREETCLEKYGVKHHNQCKEISNKISTKKKTRETQEKYENTMLEKYGNTNVNLVPEIKEKYKQTLLKNYGVTNPLKNIDIYNKHIMTMKENNSFRKSKDEEELYKQLCEKYGQDDVIRQYKDERYPYNCDFYIKSKDLFIEVNIHPSHGKHPFDKNNQEDILLLEKLKKDNSDWSKMIIDVWTIRDVEKLECAKRNNLNYETIYLSNK